MLGHSIDHLLMIPPLIFLIFALIDQGQSDLLIRISELDISLFKFSSSARIIILYIDLFVIYASEIMINNKNNFNV